MSIKNALSQTNRRTIFIVALAAVLRLVCLDLKPPHFDEGVNGWFVDQMARTGFYHYDPENYHGPLHFYVLFIFQTLFGRHTWALRLPLVIVGTLTVYLVTKFDRFLGERASSFAALAMAVSPAAVFYSRYAIHESWLVLFLILTVWGLFGLWSEGKTNCLRAVAIGVTGMILTKETYFIHIGCFVLAGICLKTYEHFSPSSSLLVAKKQWPFKDLLILALLSMAVITFFYSGTLLDFSSLKGLYQTYAAWFQTGRQGHGHEKPFFYWLTLMLHYEWIALVGLMGSMRYLRRGADRRIRYLAIYGVGTLLAYSIIHYKTPWCIITLIWPFFFVFGALYDELFSMVNVQAVIATVSVLTVASLVTTVRLNFFHYTDEREPYVYVQTLKDINKLTRPLFKLVANDPNNYHLAGHIMLPSYHPLPWVLGDFTSIGYYEEGHAPDEMDADFLLVDKSRIHEVEELLTRTYFTEKLKLRGSMDPGKLYLSCEKFHGVFPNRAPDFVGSP